MSVPYPFFQICQNSNHGLLVATKPTSLDHSMKLEYIPCLKPRHDLTRWLLLWPRLLWKVWKISRYLFSINQNRCSISHKNMLKVSNAPNRSQGATWLEI